MKLNKGEGKSGIHVHLLLSDSYIAKTGQLAFWIWCYAMK